MSLFAAITYIVSFVCVCVCLCSIFRVFSADRKRVETALENCNLPSGRVGHQKHHLPLVFTATLYRASHFLSTDSFVLTIHSSIYPSIHPSFQPFKSSSKTAAASLVWRRVLFSGRPLDSPLKPDLVFTAVT